MHTASVESFERVLSEQREWHVAPWQVGLLQVELLLQGPLGGSSFGGS